MPQRPTRLRYLAPLGGLLASAWGLAAYTTQQLNGPPKRTWIDELTFTPWEFQVPHETVNFPSEDGVSLHGWWFPRPESERVVVAFTGHRGTKTDLLGITSSLWRAGNNVFLFDFRGCGLSAPGQVSVGYYEQRDARAALRLVRERLPHASLGVIGYSMGGVIAILMAAADPTIRAVVADSPYAAISDVVAAGYRRRRLPSRPFLDLSDRYNAWRYGYRFGDLRPIDAIGKLAPRPLLLMHGEADAITPVEHARRLFAAARDPKELWLFPDTPHCGGYFLDRETYVARVADFFDQHLR